MSKHSKRRLNTSWQNVSGWYNKLVKDEGHFYHQKIVIPKTLEILSLKTGDSIVDLGCGQGVLGRMVPKETYYQGIDLASSLIASAKSYDRNSLHHYMIADVSKSFSLDKKDFTHAVVILALQNMVNPLLVLKNINAHLKEWGKLVIVLNHPCFRIPRQTSWGIDERNKTQYRRVNAYMSYLKIPINMHPGDKNSKVTWSFHYPLSSYSDFLQKSGFIIEKIEEWTSTKTSVGKAAKMENRAREEMPLFMTIIARKYH